MNPHPWPEGTTVEVRDTVRWDQCREVKQPQPKEQKQMYENAKRGDEILVVRGRNIHKTGVLVTTEPDSDGDLKVRLYEYEAADSDYDHTYINHNYIQPITTGAATMKPTFETKHYINGTEAKSLDENALIQVIADGEAQIERLKAVKTKSTAITKKIAQIEETLKSVVAELDSRAAA